MQVFIMHLSFANFTVASVALGLMLACARTKPRSSYYEPILFWLIHAWVFWATVVAMRLIFNYQGPSLWATTWNAIVQLHAFIGIAGLMLVRILHRA